VQIARVLGVDGGVEVHVEGEEVGGEDEGDDPFEYRGGVVASCECAGDEGDCEDYFYDYEDEFDPEGGAEDAVVSVAWGWVSLGRGGGWEGRPYGCLDVGIPNR